MTLHLYQARKKLACLLLPIEQGGMDLAKLCTLSHSSVNSITFEKVAVSNGKVSKPSYVPIDSPIVPANPGEHVYVMAKGTGRLSAATTCTLLQPCH